jgi:hypothetical protein
MLSMHFLNTLPLRCIPYHVTCKLKRKHLIFYSISGTYSKHEPSISSTTTELHVLFSNTKIIIRVRITKDKTFILLKQEHSSNLSRSAVSWALSPFGTFECFLMEAAALTTALVHFRRSSANFFLGTLPRPGCHLEQPP